MRKILFSILAGGLILFSCSKSADNNNASIVGTWKVNIITAQFYIDNVLTGDETTTDGVLIFESNGNATSTDSTGTYTGTYTYNSSSKQLTVISDNDTSYGTVTNLTFDNLHIKQDESSISNGHTERATSDADYSRQ